MKCTLSIPPQFKKLTEAVCRWTKELVTPINHRTPTSRAVRIRSALYNLNFFATMSSAIEGHPINFIYWNELDLKYNRWT